MNTRLRLSVAFVAISLACSAAARPATLPNITLQPAEVLTLWPGAAPGETVDLGPERIVPERPRPFDQITDQGHVLRRGDLIICGAIGGAQPAVKGGYSAGFGPLGTLVFKLE